MGSGRCGPCPGSRRRGWTAGTQKRPPVAGEILYRVLTFLGFGMLFMFQFVGPLHPLRLWRTPEAISWVLGRPDRAVACVRVVGAAASGTAVVGGASRARKAITSSTPALCAGCATRSTPRLLSAALWLGAEKGTAWSLMGFVLLTAGYVMKARIEERFLREELECAGLRLNTPRVCSDARASDMIKPPPCGEVEKSEGFFGWGGPAQARPPTRNLFAALRDFDLPTRGRGKNHTASRNWISGRPARHAPSFGPAARKWSEARCASIASWPVYISMTM